MKLIALFLACTFLFVGCSAQNPQANNDAQQTAYHKITAEEAKKMMDEDDVLIVDVRTSDEYTEKHIPNAILIPNEDITTKQPQLLPDLDATILVYCRSGNRSKTASDKLVAIGYKNIYDFGGIIDWRYETVKGDE